MALNVSQRGTITYYLDTLVTYCTTSSLLLYMYFPSAKDERWGEKYDQTEALKRSLLQNSTLTYCQIPVILHMPFIQKQRRRASCTHLSHPAHTHSHTHTPSSLQLTCPCERRIKRSPPPISVHFNGHPSPSFPSAVISQSVHNGPYSCCLCRKEAKPTPKCGCI